MHYRMSITSTHWNNISEISVHVMALKFILEFFFLTKQDGKMPFTLSL